MSDDVLQTVPLDFQWPTIDPFLFCVHHDDAYPAGDHRLAPPAAALDGRDIGQDFAGIDGWRMYHGEVVPGFPSHPHRGFETVTYVRQGTIDHADSLGAAARFGAGDTQWVTAGAGIVHSEMFPLLRRGAPNPLELFQIWLNLPAEDKLAEPHFTMLWDEDIPRVTHRDDQGRTASVTVIAGELEGRRPPPPPPRSWAARPESQLAIWHVRLDPGASWTLPTTGDRDVVRTLYGFVGTSLAVGGTEIGASTAAVVRSDTDLGITAGPDATEILVLQGRPIGEPVARYGPFVMNTDAEIHQAFADYRRTEFGGWPWPSADPDHGPTAGRFARHADGHTEARDAPARA